MKGATVKTKDGHCQGKRESAMAKPLRSILDVELEGSAGKTCLELMRVTQCAVTSCK